MFTRVEVEDFVRRGKDIAGLADAGSANEATATQYVLTEKHKWPAESTKQTCNE